MRDLEKEEFIDDFFHSEELIKKEIKRKISPLQELKFTFRNRLNKINNDPKLSLENLREY